MYIIDPNSKLIEDNLHKTTMEKVKRETAPKKEVVETTVLSDKWKPTKSGIAGSMIGASVGIGYSFYKKTGFWKGLGITILSQIVFSNLFGGIEKLTKK